MSGIENNPLARRIAELAERIYKAEYGSRNPDTLSTLELEKIHHEAAIEAQRERRREGE